MLFPGGEQRAACGSASVDFAQAAQPLEHEHPAALPGSVDGGGVGRYAGR